MSPSAEDRRVTMVPGRTSMESPPENVVIVVHSGWRQYLEPCLRRAVKSNPNGRVVLLGDDANAAIGIGEHYSIHDETLQDDLEEFRAIYRHHSSSQGVQFEQFCIERWLLIRNFLRREGLSRCLAIDSDVLLFCNVSEETVRFQSYAMTFGRWDSVRCVPHCNFIQSRDALEAFCGYVLDVYRHPQRLERIKTANRKKFDNFWVSDMSLFFDWASLGGYPVGLFEEMIEDGAGFDTCVDDTRTFRPCGYLPGLLRQWKKIAFFDGIPHAFLRAHGRAVSMKCLHYHGPLKLLMERHARGQSDDWGIATTMLRHKFGRLPSKVSLFYKNYITALFAR
jgi:hypothetical protein